MSFVFFGQEDVTLKVGEGPDHSIFDVYIGGTLWESIDGYADSPDERTVTIPLEGDGPHLFEIRNRHEKNLSSSGYKVRFKSLAVDGLLYDLHTIQYEYDLLSRLLSADYYPGENLAATPFRQYDYWFDLVGNRRQQIVTVSGTPTTTNYTYNEANQLTSDGTNTYTYDPNGNLWKVNSTQAYSWDQGNRLLSLGGIDYKYDGAGNRIQQDNGVDVTKYLLDLQPGLTVVLGATVGSDTTRLIHSPRGIHAQENPADVWTYPIQDALGSVRAETNASAVLQAARSFDPFGNVFAEDIVGGFVWMPYHFTGEPRDENDLNYHRARYLRPTLGAFTSLDPVEGLTERIMSLNSYSWVEGNVPNVVDPSGQSISYVGNPLSSSSVTVANILSNGGCDNLPIHGNEICFNQCKEKGVIDISTCVAVCEDFLIEDLRSKIHGSAIESTILGSTVTLATIAKNPQNGCNSLEDVLNDKRNGTSNCLSSNSSIGTVVHNGIMANDHYFKRGSDTIHSEDNGLSMNYIKEFDWLYVGGAGDKYAFIPVSELSASFVTGTMLIKLPTWVNLSYFGVPASIASVDLQRGDPVYFAYYPGDNAVLGHYPDQSRFQVGVEPFFSLSSNSPSYFWLSNDVPTFGDSGGGRFNAAGQLIGVLQGGTSVPFVNQYLPFGNYTVVVQVVAKIIQ